MNPQQYQSLISNNPNISKYLEQQNQVINVTSEQQGMNRIQGGTVQSQINQNQSQSIFQNSSSTSRTEIKVITNEEHSSNTNIVVSDKKKDSSYEQFLDIENTSDLFCKIHGLEKEYIIMENIAEYKKLMPICAYCIAELERAHRKKINSECFTSVLYNNSHTILSIKNKQVDIQNLNQGSQCRSVFTEQIQVLVEELAQVCEEFSTKFIQVVDSSNSSMSYSAVHIKKIQNFIENISLRPDGTPELQDIGKEAMKPLKIKYIKLAGFLLRFDGFAALSETAQSFTGVTSVFKSHITRIIEIRKKLVVSITEWLKFLMGPFYEFVFGLEKVSVDGSFRKSYFSLIEFIHGEVNINNITINQHKDYLLLLERISILEKENKELRERKVEVNQSEEISILQKKIVYLQSVIENHKTEITNVTNINKTEITNILNKHKTDIINISKSFEIKISELNFQISNYFGQIEGFKKQIESISRERDDYRFKLEQTSGSVNVKIESYVQQINEFNIKIQNVYGELSSWKAKYEHIKNEYDILIVKIGKIEEERNNFRSEAESLKINITNINVTINSYVNEINNLKREREGFISKMEQINNESNIRIENHINQYTIVIKEKEDQMRKWESEAQEWKLKYEQISIKINHYEEKINVLNIQINKYVENITIINGQISEWERKYRLIVVERDGYLKEAERLRIEVNNHTKVVETSSEKTTIIVKEKENYINELQKEIAEWKFRHEQLNIRITEYEQRITELNVVIKKHTESITIINNQSGDWEKKYNILVVERDNYQKEVERLRVEIMNHTKVVENHTEKHTVIIKEKEESAKQWEREALNWKLQYENIVKQIEIYEKKIFDLNTVISKHTETVTIINSQAGDWENKYKILVVERDNYLKEVERLRTEIMSSSTVIESHTEKHTIVIREKDERINGLIQEAAGWRIKYETLIKRIEEYEKRITDMQKEIYSYTEKFEVVHSESGDWETKYWMLMQEKESYLSEIERLQTEIHSHTSVVERHTEKHTIIIREREEKIKGLEGDLINLKLELNSKISIISRLELTIKSYEQKISDLNSQIESYNKQIISINSEKTTEIHRHILLINTCKEEFFKLSESYESLLIDIKQQISINEALRKLVIELMNKIEEHNHTIGSLDMQIKQQIEILTRQSLSKKYIDALPSIDVVTKSEREMLALRSKVGRMETEKLHKSQVFESSSQNVIEVFEKKEIFTNNSIHFQGEVSGGSAISSNVTNINSNVSNNIKGGLSGIVTGLITDISSNTTNVVSENTNVTSNTTTNVTTNVTTNNTAEVVSKNISSNVNVENMMSNLNKITGGSTKVETFEKHDFTQIQTGGEQQGAFNYLADLDNLKNIQANLNNLHKNISTNVQTNQTNVQVSEHSQKFEEKSSSKEFSSKSEVNVSGQSQQQILESLSKQVVNDSVYLNHADC